jgi:Carboxypeptidase regulatory-like domain
MRPWLSRFLRHRFVAVPGAIGVVVIGWNVYILTHDHGIVRGRVVGPDGQPVPGATVRMMEQNFTTNSDRGITTTDRRGAFEFTDNRSHNIQLRAEKPGVGRSDVVVVRLYFRAQDVTLHEPLRVAKIAP